MASSRHPPTLLLPSLPKHALVGIDLLALSASSRFQGFTTLPPGWHFLFVGATAELSSRQGVWFRVPDPAGDDDDDGDGPPGRAGRKRQRADSQELGVRGAVVPVEARATVSGDAADVRARDWLAVLRWDANFEQLRVLTEEPRVQEWRDRMLGSAELQAALFPYRRAVMPDVAGDGGGGARVEELSDDDDEGVVTTTLTTTTKTRSKGFANGDSNKANGGGGAGGGGGGEARDAAKGSKPAISPPQDFISLASYIDEPLLSRICGPSQCAPGTSADTRTEFWTLDTGSCTASEAEAEKIPGLDYTDEALASRPLGFAPIDLKVTWPAGAVGRERTIAARDRSWKLGEVVAQIEGRTPDAVHVAPEADEAMELDATEAETGVAAGAAAKKMETARNGHDHDDAENNGPDLLSDPGSGEWGAQLLGELQFCFLMVQCLANWSCLTQWRQLLDLCLTSTAAVRAQPRFFVALLDVVQLQLRHTDLVDNGLFDVEADAGDFLRRLLRRFGAVLADLVGEGEEAAKGKGSSGLGEVQAAYDALRDVLRQIWGWELDTNFVRRGMQQLEDGEMVELDTGEADDEDESGEYAPVVVEV